MKQLADPCGPAGVCVVEKKTAMAMSLVCYLLRRNQLSTHRRLEGQIAGFHFSSVDRSVRMRLVQRIAFSRSSLTAVDDGHFAEVELVRLRLVES